MVDALRAESPEDTLSYSENQGTIRRFAASSTGSEARRGVQRLEASSERARQLAQRATFLSAADAALLRSIFDEGKSARQISALLGIVPRSVQRRVARLTKRCLSPEFAFVALNVASFEPRLARVATLCVLHGRSVRAVAEELELTQHLVRTLRANVLAMARGAMQASKHSSPSNRRWTPGPKSERTAQHSGIEAWKRSRHSD